MAVDGPSLIGILFSEHQNIATFFLNVSFFSIKTYWIMWYCCMFFAPVCLHLPCSYNNSSSLPGNISLLEASIDELLQSFVPASSTVCLSLPAASSVVLPSFFVSHHVLPLSSPTSSTVAVWTSLVHSSRSTYLCPSSSFTRLYLALSHTFVYLRHIWHFHHLSTHLYRDISIYTHETKRCFATGGTSDHTVLGLIKPKPCILLSTTHGLSQ